MAYAQNNIGEVVSAYQKETGEVMLQFERLRLNITNAQWERIHELLYNTNAKESPVGTKLYGPSPQSRKALP